MSKSRQGEGNILTGRILGILLFKDSSARDLYSFTFQLVLKSNRSVGWYIDGSTDVGCRGVLSDPTAHSLTVVLHFL